jgi:hypothetical protein
MHKRELIAFIAMLVESTATYRVEPGKLNIERHLMYLKCKALITKLTVEVTHL